MRVFLNRFHKILVWSVTVTALLLFGCEEFPELIDDDVDITDTGTNFHPDDTEADITEGLDTESCIDRMWTECYDGNVYWIDSCHKRGEIHTTCAGNYACEIDIDETPVCICANKWSGDNCETCPGNWDEASDCSTCKPGWVGENCDTCVRYVEANQDGDGLSWTNPFGSIQQGIDNAAQAVVNDENVDVCQVWVKTGTHYIYQNGPDDSIHLKAGIELIGGFLGNENKPGDRLPSNYDKTILSGRETDGSEKRVKHVLTIKEGNLVDSFRITGGFAPMGTIMTFPPSDEPMDLTIQFGGGIFIDDASPTVRNVTFNSNHALQGGAAYIGKGSPLFVDCTFENNSSAFGGSAVLGDGASSIQFENCRFLGNFEYAPMGGVALGTALDVKNVDELLCTSCLFSENTGYVTSVLQANDIKDIIFTNSVFTKNSTDTPSTAIGSVFAIGPSSEQASTLEFVNCTLADNFALNQTNPASLIAGDDYQLMMTNSVIWGNYSSDQCMANASMANISYTNHDCADISDTDNHNISEDPLFTLDYQLSTGSPCIDAANGKAAPRLDYLGHTRISDISTPYSGEPDSEGVFADMGAYEYQP